MPEFHGLALKNFLCLYQLFCKSSIVCIISHNYANSYLVRTWVSCHMSDYQPMYLVVNCGIFFILIIAKIPEMHKVRLFGINSTLGIDTKVDYKPKKQR